MIELFLEYGTNPHIVGRLLLYAGGIMFCIFWLNTISARRILLYAVIFGGVLGVIADMIRVMGVSGVAIEELQAILILIFAVLMFALVALVTLLWIARQPLYRVLAGIATVLHKAGDHVQSKADEQKADHADGELEELARSLVIEKGKA